jgi:uncharacterized membrane-anchored protein
MNFFARTLLFAAVSLALLADGDKPPASIVATNDPAARAAAIIRLVGSLHPKTGAVDLRSGLATVNVSDGFYFLNPEDAEKVLVKLWGNPPLHEKPLGLLCPTNTSLVDEKSWAVVIRYGEEGHIGDNDANKIDYDKLLKEMKDAAKDANKDRVAAGYPRIDLVGWAAPPRYDAVAHKLYWAKEIEFGGSPEHTLNYNIRVLGRKGVMELNAVAPMAILKEVDADVPKILSMVEFNKGNRYDDFDKSTDKMATYGLAALVAGGIAAKAGLFKGLLVGLVAAKKFIILAFVALAGWFKRLFGGKKQPAPPAQDSPGPLPPPSVP